MVIKHDDIDIRELRKITPEEIKRNEKQFYEMVARFGLGKRILFKTAYAGEKYDILPAYDGCHVDKNDEPLPEIGIFGLTVMIVALPYYAVRETAVSVSRRL